MGREAVTIGRTLAGAGIGAAGIITHNPQLTYLGASQFLQGGSRLLFGAEGRAGEAFTTDTSTSRSLPVIYGQRIVGGSPIFFEEFSDNVEKAWMVLAFCHGGTWDSDGTPDGSIEKFIAIKDDTKQGGLDFRKTVWQNGTVQDPYKNGIEKVNIHKGAYNQTVDSDLNNELSDWTSDHKGQGVVYAAIKLNWDKEVWDGIPKLMAEVKGPKVYDPRDSSWKFSRNPALCILDYLTNPVYGIDANYPERDSDGTVSEINEQSFKDMADFCDELVQIDYHDSDLLDTRERFQCNGAVSTDNSPTDNLLQLLTSCRGEFVFQEGEYKLHIPRDVTTTNFTLNEDNIVGGWEWRRGGTEDVPNLVKAKYPDDFVSTDMNTATWPEPEDNNPYLDEDNGYNNQRDIELPFSIDPTPEHTVDLVKSIAMVGLKEARQDTEVEVTARESALQLEVGDVVPLTHETPAWEDKPFWVRALAYLPEDNLVRLTLKEYDADAYILDERKKALGPPGTNLPDILDVDAPSNFTVSTGSSNAIEGPGGERIPKAFIAWDDPSNMKFLDYYVIQFKKSSNSNWKTVAQPDRGVQSHNGPVLENQTDYDFRIKSVNVAGFESDWVTVTGHTATATGTQNPIIIADHKEIDNDNDGSADTGEATFTIFDPGGSTLDVTIKTKQGHGSFSETQNSTVFQSGDSITETVALIEKKNSYIECEATSNESGNDQNEILTFDPDKVPEFETFFGYVKDNGEIQFFVSGDTDTESIKVEFDYNGNGTFTEAQNTATNGDQHRQFSGTSNASINRTNDAQVKATLYSEPDLAGVTKVDIIDVSRIGDQVVEVDPDENRENGTWALNFTLLRPGNFSINLEEQVGDGAFASVGTGDEANLSGIGATDSYTSDNNSLSEYVTTRVKVKVTDDDSGGKVVQKETITFDPDTTPDFSSLHTTINDDDTVTVSVRGDSDTKSSKIEYDLNDDGTIDETHTTDGRTGKDTSTGGVTEGNLAAITFTLYSKTGQTGRSSSTTVELRNKTDSSTIRPEVEATPSKSGGTGSVSLTIEDPQNRVSATAFDTNVGGDDWTPSSPPDSSWDIYDTSSPFTTSASVSLDSKHQSSIAYGVRWDNGTSNVWSVNTVTWDQDVIPEHNGHTVDVDDNGNASLDILGDDDWDSATYATSTSGHPSASSVDTGTSVNGRSVTDVSLQTLSEGETLYVGIRGWTGSNGSGDKSNTIWRAKASYRTDTNTQEQGPSVDAQTSQSGSTGTLSLTVNDPELMADTLEFQKKTGSGDFSGVWSTAWDSSSGTVGSSTTLTRSEDITLNKKHNVAIKWRLQWTDSNGNSRTTANTHEFDIERVPEVVDLSASADSNGNVFTDGRADEDTATVYVTVTTDGTEPDPPTSTNADESIDVSTTKTWRSVDTGVDAGQTATVRVKARGETSGGALAGTDYILSYRFSMAGDPSRPEISAAFSGYDDNGNPQYDVEVTKSGLQGDLDLDKKVEDAANPSASSAWTDVATSTTSPLTATVTVTSIEHSVGVLLLRGIDTGVSGSGGTAYQAQPITQEDGQMPNGTELLDGLVDPGGVVTDDGSSQTSTVAGTQVSTSSASGDYPQATLWAKV